MTNDLPLPIYTQGDEWMSVIKPMDGYFPITTVSRADVGWALKDKWVVGSLTDDEMLEIADKMAEDYMNQLYWESLKIIAEEVISDRKDKND